MSKRRRLKRKKLAALKCGKLSFLHHYTHALTVGELASLDSKQDVTNKLLCSQLVCKLSTLLTHIVENKHTNTGA